jgi:hypothetical protein
MAAEIIRPSGPVYGSPWPRREALVPEVENRPEALSWAGSQLAISSTAGLRPRSKRRGRYGHIPGLRMTDISQSETWV